MLWGSGPLKLRTLQMFGPGQSARGHSSDQLGIDLQTQARPEV